MDLQKEYREKAEAILFASGKLMKFEEIARVGRFRNLELLKQTLLDLRDDYEQRNGPIKIENHEELWKMSVNERHAETVKKIVPTTELSRSITETLAVIAFKYPIMQSDLIKIRSNKGYEHLEELEKIGFISRQKYGRTRLIKLTPKFFEYFNLPEGKIKEQFKDFEQIAASLEKKEEEIANEKEIKIEPYEEKLGDLDVFDEGKKSVHHAKEIKEKKEPMHVEREEELEVKNYSEELKEEKKEREVGPKVKETEEKQEADVGKFFDKQKEKRNRKKHDKQEIKEDKISEEDLSYENIMKEVRQEELGEKQKEKPNNLEEEIEKKSDEIANEIMHGEKSEEEEQKESEEEGSEESKESDNENSDKELEEQTEDVEEEPEKIKHKRGRKKKENVSS